MFESIRTHRRWLMLFMLVLIFPSFVFFGIQGYNSFVDTEGALAKVAGVSITQQEFDAAQRDRSERLRQALGANFDPKLLESPEARSAILDSLLLDRALTAEASRVHVAVSNDQLRDVIAGIPAFQDEGRFSMERYRAYLTSQGLTERAFEERVRQDLRKQQLIQTVSGTAIVPKQIADRLERIVLEQREVRVLTLPLEAYVAKVAVDDKQVAAFYDNNQRLFETPESAKVEYLVLDAETVGRTVKVADADIRAYYDQNQARYGTDAQWRASHILITPEGGDKAAARKTAEAVAERVRANPKDFAKIARETSKDTGSAANGGDLGFFGKGMMVKPFEEAASQLKPGETSDLVETEFGFHIIRLNELKPAQVKPFDEVRAEIENDLRSQQAQKRFAEAAEQFTNLVYEQSDSLKPAADKLQLEVRVADSVTRSGLPAAPDKPQVFNARVVEAVFADDAIKNKRNTQAIEVAPSTMVAARVVEYRPASVRPLGEVKAAVRQRLERQEAARLAREAGAARLAELRAKPSDAGFSPVLTVSRRAPQGMPPPMLGEILRAPADKLPAYLGSDVEGAGYLIAHVLSSKPPEALDAAQREAQTRAMNQQLGLADELAYADALKSRYGAKVLKADLRPDPAQAPEKAGAVKK